MKRVSSAFDRVDWIFIESDSTDATPQLLEQYTSQIENFRFRSLGNLSGQISDRVARIAHCRNQYLLHIEDNLLVSKDSWLAVTDLDDLNTHLQAKDVLSAISLDVGDAYFANQRGPYFDIFALRHPVWNPEDCFETLNALVEEGFSPQLASIIAVQSKQISIPSNEQPFQVESAFGGFGLYKADSIRGARYTSLDADGQLICEHVGFHRQLVARGLKLFIVPALINSELTEHTGRRHPFRLYVQPLFTFARQTLGFVFPRSSLETIYKKARDLVPFL